MQFDCIRSIILAMVFVFAASVRRRMEKHHHRTAKKKVIAATAAVAVTNIKGTVIQADTSKYVTVIRFPTEFLLQLPCIHTMNTDTTPQSYTDAH